MEGASSKYNSTSEETEWLSPGSLRRIWVAARLQLVSDGFFERFTDERLGVEVGYKRAWDAARSRQARSSWRGKPGPRAKKKSRRRVPRETPALWDWVVVDEPAFGLLRVLFRLPNNGFLRPKLLEALSDLPGIRQVVEVSGDREILAIAVVEDLDEAENLRSRIQDHATDAPVEMDLISHENHRPARQTWEGLARREVERDRAASA